MVLYGDIELLWHEADDLGFQSISCFHNLLVLIFIKFPYILVADLCEIKNGNETDT